MMKNNPSRAYVGRSKSFLAHELSMLGFYASRKRIAASDSAIDAGEAKDVHVHTVVIRGHRLVAS